MRSPFRFTAASLLVAIAACSDGTKPELDASLQRDLRLASTTSFTLPPSGSEELLLETAPSAVEEPKVAPHRAPSGNRRVRSERPTVAAAPVLEEASGTDARSVLETITQPTEASGSYGAAEVETADAADATDAVPLPRPTPVSIEGDGDVHRGDGGRGGRGDGGWGIGGIGGGWGGVVIRGGDIDDCKVEPRTRRGPIARRPDGSVGGIGGSRWPAAERGQTRTGGAEGARAGRWPVSGSRSGSSSSGGGRWPVRQ